MTLSGHIDLCQAVVRVGDAWHGILSGVELLLNRANSAPPLLVKACPGPSRDSREGRPQMKGL
jgi:hypothetical protein